VQNIIAGRGCLSQKKKKKKRRKKMENFDLNNPGNLNPDLKDIARANQPQQNPPRQEIPRYTPDEKKIAIKKFDERPVVKENGIKAYDSKKYSTIPKWMKPLAITGIIAVVIVAISIFMIAWIIASDGTLLNPISMVCGNHSITCEGIEVPAQNFSCDCGEVVCGNLTCIFPNEINVNMNNGT
jgi:hypothetical protein